MSESDESGKGRGEGWTLWGSQQMEIARARRNTLITGLAGVGLGAFCFLYISHLHGRVDYLATNQVMFCEALGDGMYGSTREHPEEMAVDYARDFVQHLKQFDWDTVDKSFQAAMRMMAPEVAAANKPVLDEEARKARRQYLSQYFNRISDSIEETDSGFSYSVKGRIAGFTGSTELRPRTVEVRVELRKIAPTEARPQGLMVVSSSG